MGCGTSVTFASLMARILGNIQILIVESDLPDRAIILFAQK